MIVASEAGAGAGLTRGQRVLLVLGVMLLGLSAFFGISGGLREVPRATGAGRIWQSYMQLAYGVSALSLGLVRFLLHRVSWALGAAFIVTVGLAAGLAPVYWGGANAQVGIFSGSVAAGVAFGIIKLVSFGLPTIARVAPGAAAAPADSIHSEE